jgi:hypothetical protein
MSYSRKESTPVFAVATQTRKYQREVPQRIFEVKAEVRRLAEEIARLAHPVAVEVETRGRWSGMVEGDLDGWREMVRALAGVTLEEPGCAAFTLRVTGSAGRIRTRLGRFDFTAHFDHLPRPKPARTFLDLAGRKVLGLVAPELWRRLALRLGAAGMKWTPAPSLPEAMDRLKQERFDLVIVEAGADTSVISGHWPSLPVARARKATASQVAFEDRLLRWLRAKRSWSGGPRR